MISRYASDILLFAGGLAILLFSVSGIRLTSADAATSNEYCIKNFNIVSIPFEEGSTEPMISKPKEKLVRNLVRSGGALNISRIWLGVWADKEYENQTFPSKETKQIAEDRQAYVSKILPDGISVIPVNFTKEERNRIPFFGNHNEAQYVKANILSANSCSQNGTSVSKIFRERGGPSSAVIILEESLF